MKRGKNERVRRRVRLGVWALAVLAWLGSRAHAADPEPLVLSLFAEGDWSACRVEGLRAMRQAPDDPWPMLLTAAATLRLNPADARAQAMLEAIALDDARSVDLSAMAAYERGRASAAAGHAADAVPWLKQAFLTARDRALFLRAGRLLCRLDDSNDASVVDPALRDQLRAARPLWAGQRQDNALEDTMRPVVGSAPGQWIVSFYRSQISPAIASRCALIPSCSEYFRLACIRHGLVGFPMGADRLIREPSVIASGPAPIAVGGELRFPDPVSDHDFWMKGR